jgi:peptidyl-prolyl cis-trans isomerase A (cyclophilin A)
MFMAKMSTHSQQSSSGSLLSVLFAALLAVLKSSFSEASESVHISFINFSNEDVSLYWHDGQAFEFVGNIMPYENFGQGTFVGHLFAYGEDFTEYIVEEPSAKTGVVHAIHGDRSIPVLCHTTKGDLRITIEPAWSPLGAGRFLELVNQHYLDGCALNRVVPRFLTQLGIGANYEQRTRYRSHTIPDDVPPNIPFQPGTMSYAGSGPDSRTTEFFIVMPDTPPGQLEYFGSNPWETPFGYVNMEDVTNVVGQWYSYGDMPPWGQGPDPQLIYKEDGYEYLQKKFPNMDYIEACQIVEENEKEEL